MKSKIRISKSETNSKFKLSKQQYSGFHILVIEDCFEFHLLREAASAKAGISCFEFKGC